MSLQEADSGSSSKIVTARMAIRAHLEAKVTDTGMRIPIAQFTEVLAEPGPGKGEMTILWPYGEATAQAVVPRSFLQISPGQ